MLTDEQREALKPYEKYLYQMHFAKYVSWPDRNSIHMMLKIWEEVKGKRRGFDFSCRRCVENLVRDVARLYYKEEYGNNKD